MGIPNQIHRTRLKLNASLLSLQATARRLFRRLFPQSSLSTPTFLLFPKSYPVVNFVLSRLTSLRSKSDSPESGFDIEQPPPPSESDEAPFVDPLVEQMPYLKDPEVIAEMSKVVTEISQTQFVLEGLDDRPDHETVDKVKEKMAEIDSKLALQLEEIALRQRPSEMSLDNWESHLADKKEEKRESTEKEKALYRLIIQLEDMHLEYAKLLKGAEKRLMKIYEVVASTVVDKVGKGVVEDEDGVDEGPSEEVNDDVVGILRKNASGGDVNRVDLSGKRLRFLPEALGKIRGHNHNQLQIQEIIRDKLRPFANKVASTLCLYHCGIPKVACVRYN